MAQPQMSIQEIGAVRLIFDTPYYRGEPEAEDVTVVDLQTVDTKFTDLDGGADIEALKQAEFQVRPCVVHGAPHYWLSDPIDEPGSHSGFVAPRLLRFLTERL